MMSYINGATWPVFLIPGGRSHQYSIRALVIKGYVNYPSDLTVQICALLSVASCILHDKSLFVLLEAVIVVKRKMVLRWEEIILGIQWKALGHDSNFSTSAPKLHPLLGHLLAINQYSPTCRGARIVCMNTCTEILVNIEVRSTHIFPTLLLLCCFLQSLLHLQQCTVDRDGGFSAACHFELAQYSVNSVVT